MSVLPFPMFRSAGVVAGIVAELHKRDGQGVDEYWRKMIKATRANLAAAGLSEAVINNQCGALASAVFETMRERFTGLDDFDGGHAA